MCGIAGVVRFEQGGDDGPVVHEMTDALARRGPDDRGIETDGPVTLGNRRLAILDLSDAGHQPMRSRSGRYLITFNGEIYNHKELHHELGVEPEELRSSTDTEIILLAWEKWGPAALERMVGQWAFAIYDNAERRLYLARDRFGEKPLFYHRSDDALTFASSIPSLLQAPWVRREIDEHTLLEYVTLRYVVAPRTILTDIFKLPGGHLLIADADGVTIERWYTPHFRPHAARRKRADLVEEFDTLFTRASKRCLVSDVPVALLLSDGIDSNSIHAALTAQNQAVRSFTYTLTDNASGLSPAEERDGSTTMDLLVTPEDRIKQMVPAFASFTEPTGDGAALATWLLIRNARDQATVFLCGHGGDEVLGGYRLSQDRFRLSVVRKLARLPEPWIAKIIDRHVYGAEPVELRRRAILDAPPHRTPAAARYIIHRPLPPTDLAELFGAGSIPEDGYLSTVDRLYERCLEDATDIDRMQEVMLHTFLSENILTFADSVAMDSSAELRMPFLDRDLVDFVLSLPPSMRVGQRPGRANTKLILRWWSRGRVPQDIVSRRKRAFPFGNLPELLMTHGDTLRDRILGSTAVRRALPGAETWLRHPPEYFRGPWEGTLWALLALGIWCEAHGVK
jgi:asparagine synthase (glutamine-hydrolysing)